MQSVFTKGLDLLNGSTMKLVAVTSMTIDHFAAGVVYYLLLYHCIPQGMDFEGLYRIYQIMRGIGRTAFPIYCFLLIEGLIHTRSRVKYLGNLLLFAALSEIPFDLALCLTEGADSPYLFSVLLMHTDEILDHQNVFFTLAIGLSACWGIEALRKRFGISPVTVAASVPIAIAAAYLADRLHTDYHSVGVFVILVLYLLRPVCGAAAAAAYLVLTRLSLEEWAFPAFIMMFLYNGKRGFLGRGRFAKYFFYWYYPLHLMLFALIRIRLLQVM